MNEPTIAPISPDLDRLLEVERAAPGPSPESRARIAGRLSAVVGIPLPVGTAATVGSHLGGAGAAGGVGAGASGAATAATVGGASAGASGATTAAAIAGAKIVAIVVAGSAAVGGGAWVAGRAIVHARHAAALARATHARRAAMARAPRVAVPVSPPPVVAPPAAPAPVPSAPPPRRAVDTRTAPPRPSPLAAEGALLDGARSDLARGDPASALKALGRYRARYPHGTLDEEAGALRVIVLCRLGRGTAARQAATAFYARWPGSLLRGVVDRALAELPSGPVTDPGRSGQSPSDPPASGGSP